MSPAARRRPTRPSPVASAVAGLGRIPSPCQTMASAHDIVKVMQARGYAAALHRIFTARALASGPRMPSGLRLCGDGCDLSGATWSALMRTFARLRWRSAVQWLSSGRYSSGLPNSCRLRRALSGRRSSTGVASRLPSTDRLRSWAHCFSSPARNTITRVNGLLARCSLLGQAASELVCTPLLATVHVTRALLAREPILARREACCQHGG